MISPSAVLEVNLKNIIYNYKYLSSLNNNQNTGATIKANAYGLGDIEIIKILYKCGCRHFFVATIEEALTLRKKFKFGYLYVLNGVNKNDINNYLNRNKIIPIVNSIQNLEEIKSLKINIQIGIHIDTGINRLGISIDDLNKFKNNKNIIITLVLSHFASADEKNNPYNYKQLKTFKEITNKYFKYKLKSMSNSAGLTLSKKKIYQLTRPGIAIYGGHNNTILKKKIKPVVKLKAEILQIKEINKNEFVGYNQIFCSKKKMIIAIISIGYADGILRQLSNKGYVYYKKCNFKIIGRISMDTLTIDITNNAKLLKVGMLVDLINYENDIEKLAKSCGTISNEILTSISNRVKRIYKH